MTRDDWQFMLAGFARGLGDPASEGGELQDGEKRPLRIYRQVWEGHIRMYLSTFSHTVTPRAPHFWGVAAEFDQIATGRGRATMAINISTEKCWVSFRGVLSDLVEKHYALYQALKVRAGILSRTNSAVRIRAEVDEAAVLQILFYLVTTARCARHRTPLARTSFVRPHQPAS